MTPATYTILQFCQMHKISRNLFYTLKNKGLAPRLICVGKRRLISVEAAAEWRQEMEALSSPQEAGKKDEKK